MAWSDELRYAPAILRLLVRKSGGTVTVRPGYALYRPASKALCLCGSGKSFQHCCKGRLPGSNIGKRTQEMLATGKWHRAIKEARADVCQYSIWHRSHTVPGVVAKPALRYGFLMGVDIEALSDYVEILMGAYARNGWIKRLPEVLNRLKLNIEDKRWLRKIAYQRAICALWQDDYDQARLEISSIRPITAANDDVDLLQLQADINSERMGMTEKISIYQRICEISASRSDKLQYGACHAVELMLVGDKAAAKAKLDHVIAFGRQTEEGAGVSIAAEIWFCRALEIRGVMDADPTTLLEAAIRLRKIADAPEKLTRAGKASVLASLGDAYRYAGKHEEAIQAYREAYAVQSDLAIRIFEADCELRLGKLDQAFSTIRSVAVDKLDTAQRADHAFIFFAIALARRDRQSLADSRELLKTIETPAPYFNQLRLSFIVKVGEAIEALDTKDLPPELPLVLEALKTTSRYLKIEPGILGVSVNVNAIIDDFIERATDSLASAQGDVPAYRSPD